MRSKHLSVRKCIDKKPDKIKGIVCICIILAVVCAGNMIPNYLISLKAAKIAKTVLQAPHQQQPAFSYLQMIL